MSSVTIQNEIEYPESDGKPMGETDLHRDWMVRLLEIFRQRYAGQRVYIASDLLVYYVEGTPSKFVVPDCFVVLDWPAQKSGISGQLIYPVFVPEQQAGIARCLRAWRLRPILSLIHVFTSRTLMDCSAV